MFHDFIGKLMQIYIDDIVVNQSIQRKTECHTAFKV